MQHLEGITVLNSYMTYTTPWWVSLFLLGIIPLAWIAYWCFDQCHEYIGALFTLLTVVCLIFVLVGAFGGFEVEAGMVYECIIDRSVSFQELTSVYEVVKQRGDIYVLKFLK